MTLPDPPEASADSLLGLVYVSKALTDFGRDSLDLLAREASFQNEIQRITGFLYYADRRFLQYLEGPPAAVSSLMESIEKDPRHEVLRQVEEPGLAERRFQGWSMRWIRPDQLAGVHIEGIVLDHLLLSRPAYNADNHWLGITWRMVNLMARHRAKLIGSVLAATLWRLASHGLGPIMA